MLTTGLKTKYGAFCDLHSSVTMVHIIDRKAKVKVHKEIASTPGAMMKIIKPFENDISVYVESTFNYYWVADLCEKKRIPFFLGHALYIKRARQGKHKDDDRDTHLMAGLARRDSFPLAYHYPSEMRSARDLFRRRMSFVTYRAGLYKRIQNVVYQHGYVDSVTEMLKKQQGRYAILTRFKDPTVALTVEKDISMIDKVDIIINELEIEAKKKAIHYDPLAYRILTATPGIGDACALTILYEVHNVKRFSTVQDFSSYSRTVSAACESAGKRVGKGDSKIGNPTLCWVFHEITCHMQRFSPPIKLWYENLKKRKGPKCAKAIFAHKVSVAVYYMLKRKELFDENRFLGCYNTKSHTTNRKS